MQNRRDTRRLTRAGAGSKIGGVCAGLANYFEADVTLVRLLWIVLTIIPGAIVGGVLAYLVAWLVMPASTEATPLPRSRLVRSTTERMIGGVCGGIGEFLNVDPTLVRLIWVVLTIIPGGIVGGVVAYLGAWLVIPVADSASPMSVPVPTTSSP